MIRSMTGYGKAESEIEDVIFNVEVKTLNSRYRDITIRMPHDLQEMEMDIRSWVSARIARGRVELFIRMEILPNEAHYELILNEPLARAYMNIFERLSKELNINANISMDTFCHLRDVIIQKPKGLDMEKVRSALREAINNALSSVEEMRAKEGEVLEKDILKRLSIIEQGLNRIKEKAPVLISSYRDRLRENMEKLLKGTDIHINGERIEQEVAIFAERSDITEEIVRMESHLIQFREYMQGNEPVGRRLDFLIQEMNREVNTIGAKALDPLISRLVVDIKGEIEKIREQVQNIE